MVKEYLKNLENNNTLFIGGVCEMNDKFKSKILRNVISISFKNLYPNIIVQLHELGLIQKDEDIDKIKFLLENNKNNNIDVNVDDRIFVNSYWSKLHKRDSRIAYMVTDYMNEFYIDFISKHNDSIIYIDVDLIILKEIDDNILKMIDSLNISYITETIEYYLIEDRRIGKNVFLDTRRNDRLLDIGI